MEQTSADRHLPECVQDELQDEVIAPDDLPETKSLVDSLTYNALEMATLQFTDALNRTFAELKSKSEDARLRASYDLYGLVATASRGSSHL